MDAPSLALTAVFLAFALAASIVDAQTRRIPNWTVICMALSALALNIYTQTLAPLIEAAIFLVLAALALALGRRISERELIGAGDIKLVAVWCALAGICFALVGFALGCLVGALVCALRRQKTFALGPWINLASAILLVALYAPAALALP